MAGSICCDSDGDVRRGGFAVRDKVQAEANELDLAMFRLADRLGVFADEHASTQDKDAVDSLSRKVAANRSIIRRYMHPLDVEATECL